MLRRLLQIPVVLTLAAAVISSASADDRAATQSLREELWVLMTPLPLFAYVVRLVDGAPFPLAVMNHGIAIGEKERSFYPLIEFRDAAFWFARRGYFVVAPIRYGATAVNVPERGLHSLFFAGVGSCDNPNFRGPGLAIATLDQWVIDFMEHKRMVTPRKAIVVGQSGGGWGAIALSSLNPSSVRAIIVFAAGRGGRVDGKPNNNCAPDKLLMQHANSAAPPVFPCFRFTPRTTPISVRT
jgi:dienelactone hydrolase